MRIWWFCALCCCLGSVSNLEARAHLLEEGAIAAPRFGEGDVDGDGMPELVVGGRTGPFAASTTFYGEREARIEVRKLRAGVLSPAGVSDELHVVNDVAAGDVDGDGRAEIVAVGDYRLYLLAYEEGLLRVVRAQMLASGYFMHVECADVDGDGRAEIIAAESLPEPGAEVRSTEIQVYAFEGGFELRASLLLEAHVGDLCTGDLDGDGRVELVLEQGGEEMGGRVGVYGFSGLQPYERFAEQVTEDRVRLLNLSARRVGAGALLGLGDARGRVLLLRQRGEGFERVDQLLMPAAAGVLRGLHLTRIFDPAGLQLIWGAAEGAQGRLWMEGLGGY